jgi:SAM-dependent methyltransferase
MPSEHIFPLDKDTADLFALKGTPPGSNVPLPANANGLKVRRVMQLISDFANKPFDKLDILDLACGEGVYAIEAALRGATVRALDARTERMNLGAKAAERLGLRNLRFEQADVRKITAASHGGADVVLFLGILYHLDQHDVFPVLKNIHEMCRQSVIIDTHIALHGTAVMEHEGKKYEGWQAREHGDNDPEAVRKSRLQASLDNPMSFWFTKESLFRLLKDVGFTSACECSVPLEPFKPADRITIIASKGEPVRVSSYPWVNDKTELEIERFLADNMRLSRQNKGAAKGGVKQRVIAMVNGLLRGIGVEIRRI